MSEETHKDIGSDDFRVNDPVSIHVNLKFLITEDHKNTGFDLLTVRNKVVLERPKFISILLKDRNFRSIP